MVQKNDQLYQKILSFVSKSDEPLETKNIEQAFSKATRIMILYRLNNLRGDGKLKGKQVGSGKGTWIWWKQ